LEARINIRNIYTEELTAILKEMGEPAFKGKQINEWLWQKGVTDFDK